MTPLKPKPRQKPGKQTRRRTSVYTKTRESLLIREAQALEHRAEQAEAIIKGMEAVVEYTDYVKTVFDTYSFLKKFAAGASSRRG